ncbi:MAG: hypothetical protein CMJ78_15510 [Planctomycetaceae bacterium]|nr:hypothetical protein [Planctomycetaceae bacterium]
MSDSQHRLRFEGPTFWVTHRNREFGPFDYEWSKDFSGIEFVYCGEKFGEYCSCEEIYADLKRFRLPMRVVEVTSVVMGSVLFGLLNGLSDHEKRGYLIDQLQQHGMERFANGISYSS